MEELYAAKIDSAELQLYKDRGYTVFIEVCPHFEFDVIEPECVLHSIKPIRVVILPRSKMVLIRRKHEEDHQDLPADRGRVRAGSTS